jgi:hypothetical protein
MLRTIVSCVGLTLLATAGVLAGGQRGGRGVAAASTYHVAIGRDLDVMTARLGGVRPTSQQIIADARLLTSGYRSLGPFVHGFGPSDYTYNRLVARRSLEWLSRASLLYGRDPLVAAAFLSSYDSIGGFYRDYGSFYHPGAFVAYAGATRLAQRMILNGYETDRYERELNRYALAYGTIAAVNGALLTPWNTPRDLPDVDSPKYEPTVVLTQTALPAVDVTKLNAEQKAAWTEARDRFRNVAPRVYGARVLLNELSERLQRQHMSLHPQDAADALKMQSFLEDAVDLMKEGRFDTAVEALTRADYVRAKLKSVTGQ